MGGRSSKVVYKTDPKVIERMNKQQRNDGSYDERSSKKRK